MYESRYGAAVRKLEGSLELAACLPLHDHAAQLVRSVRDRCLLQYFAPYLSVSLERMAAAFLCPVPAVEEAVARLIMDGKLSARIDSSAKTLHVKTSDSRDETFRKALAPISRTEVAVIPGGGGGVHPSRRRCSLGGVAVVGLPQ